MDGEFRTGFEMKAEQLGSAKELKVRLTHGKTEFIVMDNPTRLKVMMSTLPLHCLLMNDDDDDGDGDWWR